MSLQWISILLGVLAAVCGVLSLVKPDLIKRFADLFPRSVVPAWIFTALCCVLGAREAMGMNMGFLNAYKQFVYILAPAVGIASVIYMKELLAPRALGGFLLLLAVPVITVAKLSEKPLFQIVVALFYVLIVYGLTLLMSPWWFRKINQPFLNNAGLFKAAAVVKTVMGIGLILLGLFVYA